MAKLEDDGIITVGITDHAQDLLAMWYLLSCQKSVAPSLLMKRLPWWSQSKRPAMSMHQSLAKSLRLTMSWWIVQSLPTKTLMAKAWFFKSSLPMWPIMMTYLVPKSTRVLCKLFKSSSKGKLALV